MCRPPIDRAYRWAEAASPALLPNASHPPSVYPVARVAASANPDTAAFLAWLESPAARPYFEKQGFLPLP